MQHLQKTAGWAALLLTRNPDKDFYPQGASRPGDRPSYPGRIAVRAATGNRRTLLLSRKDTSCRQALRARRTSLPPVTNHESPVTSLATLFHPWHANASANIFSPISIGAKRLLAPFAFRRIPQCRSRGTINTAGSKLVRDTVR